MSLKHNDELLFLFIYYLHFYLCLNLEFMIDLTLKLVHPLIYMFSFFGQVT